MGRSKMKLGGGFERECRVGMREEAGRSGNEVGRSGRKWKVGRSGRKCEGVEGSGKEVGTSGNEVGRIGRERKGVGRSGKEREEVILLALISFRPCSLELYAPGSNRNGRQRQTEMLRDGLRRDRHTGHAQARVRVGLGLGLGLGLEIDGDQRSSLDKGSKSACGRSILK